MSDASDLQVAEVTPIRLSSEEDSFALAVIEFGGNLPAAYKSVFGKQPNLMARAHELISRPEIALRIKAISDATEEHALISLGSHLLQLATIRDKSVKAGDLRTGLAAEVKRGEVAGFYKDKTSSGDKPAVNINFNGTTPSNMQEWGAQFGKEAVVIEMPR